MMDYFITRQPVFDKHIKIFAYELLYRKGFDNTLFDGYDKASSNVIQTGLLTIGMEELIDNKKAIIKFTHNLLLKQIAFLFPRDKIIIEIPKNIQTDDKLLDCCNNLKEQDTS